MDDQLSRLLSLVPWTLQRLLCEDYEVALAANGTPESLEIETGRGIPSIDAMEYGLRAPGLWEKSGLAELAEVREHLTPERTSEVLDRAILLRLLQHVGYLSRADLLHADWPHIVSSVSLAFQRFCRDIRLEIIEKRVGLGTPDHAHLEYGMQVQQPDALGGAVAEYFVRDMCDGNTAPGTSFPFTKFIGDSPFSHGGRGNTMFCLGSSTIHVECHSVHSERLTQLRRIRIRRAGS